jgi:hypothetical protein
LVVDDGDRALDRSLASELAELGFSSVTTSVEAADDVLALVSVPSAILLQMPRSRAVDRRQMFFQLAERLKVSHAASGTPILLVEANEAASSLVSLIGSPSESADRLETLA